MRGKITNRKMADRERKSRTSAFGFERLRPGNCLEVKVATTTAARNLSAAAYAWAKRTGFKVSVLRIKPGLYGVWLRTILVLVALAGCSESKVETAPAEKKADKAYVCAAIGSMACMRAGQCLEVDVDECTLKIVGGCKTGPSRWTVAEVDSAMEALGRQSCEELKLHGMAGAALEMMESL